MGRISKIVIHREKYHVNKEKQVVACTLYCELEFTKPEIDSIITYDMWRKRYGRSRYFIVSGKAKCHPQDIFDENLGKKIANQRAQAKMFKVACGIFEELDDLFQVLSANMLSELRKYKLLKGITISHVVR